MQVFYSQMCDLIKLGLNGRVFQCPPEESLFCGERGALKSYSPPGLKDNRKIKTLSYSLSST